MPMLTTVFSFIAMMQGGSSSSLSAPEMVARMLQADNAAVPEGRILRHSALPNLTTKHTRSTPR